MPRMWIHSKVNRVKVMSDKSIFDAIMARDLRELTRLMHPSYENARAMTQEEMEAKQLTDAAGMRGMGDDEMAARYGDGLRDRAKQFTHCDICNANPGHREMNASGVEGVICESCDEKLWREQR